MLVAGENRQKENPNMKLKIGRRTFAVATLAEASLVYGRERDIAMRKNGANASRFPAGTLTDDYGVVLHVSYNGRIWSAPWNPNEPRPTLLHEAVYAK
jgi:hypothetical protein